jgi:hypothetical protein
MGCSKVSKLEFLLLSRTFASPHSKQALFALHLRRDEGGGTQLERPQWRIEDLRKDVEDECRKYANLLESVENGYEEVEEEDIPD